MFVNKCLHIKHLLVFNIRDEKMASKKTKVVSGRVPHNIAKEMEMHNLNVQEAVQIALNSKKNPNVLFEIELRSLLSEREILASRLAHVNLMIEDYMEKLNIEKSIDELKEELFLDDNQKAVQKTLEHFEILKGESSLTIDNYIISRKGKRMIEAQLSRCDLTKEDFINLLFEKHDKSIQTKLDS